MKIVSTYLTPEARLVISAMYVLGVMTVAYNLGAAAAINRAERAVRRVGQYE